MGMAMENVKDILKTWLPIDGAWSWLPHASSVTTAAVDGPFYFLLWTCIGLFLLVIGPMVFFVIRYRRKSPSQKALSQMDHNQAMEVAWTVLPFIYLAILFYWGFVGFLHMYKAPSDAKQLRVIGQKWQWTVEYPEEGISVSGQGAVVVVPIGKPIQLKMSSQDVIHSFFIPNFRVKQDVLPGRYTSLWFEATEEGEFPIFCTEYCGDQHSNMMAILKVVSMEQFLDWVDKMKNADQGIALKDLGEKLYTKKGCNACHSVDGSPKLAPSFKGMYGKKEKLTDGRTVLVDDDYIKKSILDPAADVVMGYQPVMPTFQGQVSEREILALTEYIKSLK